MKEYIKQYYKENNYDDNIIIFGIRNDLNPDMDYFNDYIGFIFNDVMCVAKGTTDPGVYYTKNPLMKDGAFHMREGFQKNIWRLRPHKGQYLALCNDWKTKEVEGWRDTNGDFINNDKKIVSGHFGANLHKSKNEDLIYYASAGCIVTNNEDFFNLLIQAAKRSREDLFSFNLFNIKDFPTNIIAEVANVTTIS